MSEEVAVFIDLENLRYGLLKSYGQEPDFASLVEKAKKYGRPSIMRAYADFTEHPEEITRRLQIAGIESINIPVKRRTYSQAGKQIERVKNAADMVLALDAMIDALEADKSSISKVFFLVTGDRDYVKLVTLLRNRFGQRVVIVGVPGSVAGDLVNAAGEDDPIEVAKPKPVDKQILKRAIVDMVKKGPTPLSYWTLKTIDQWSQDNRQSIPGTTKERRDVIGLLVEEGVLTEEEIETKNKRCVISIVLDEKHARQLKYLD